MIEMLLAIMVWMPLEFENLPRTYHDWGADSVFYNPPIENQPWDIWPGQFPPYTSISSSGCVSCYGLKVPVIEDSTQLPFTVQFEELESWSACGNSLYGRIEYQVDTNLNWTGGRQWVNIHYSPHQELASEERIANGLYPRGGFFSSNYPTYLAVQKVFDEILSGDVPCYRHRGKWHYAGGCACGAWDVGGSFTTYLIPTEHLDLHITCITLIYEYDNNPWQGCTEEELDTLPEDIRNTWPEVIGELERAVEETFRLTERALIPGGDIPIFLGPPLPAGYSDWQKRFTLCAEDRDLSYFPGWNVLFFLERPPPSFRLPFTLKLKNLGQELFVADSFRGRVSYPFLRDDSIPQHIEVSWRPSRQDGIDSTEARLDLICLMTSIENHISLDSAGVQEIIIDDVRSFRLRAYTYEEMGSTKVNAVTGYIIPAQRHDLAVICSNKLFDYYELNQKQLSYLDESARDSVINHPEPERTWPDRIAELEQAVEQNFRVK